MERKEMHAFHRAGSRRVNFVPTKTEHLTMKDSITAKIYARTTDA